MVQQLTSTRRGVGPCRLAMRPDGERTAVLSALVNGNSGTSCVQKAFLGQWCNILYLMAGGGLTDYFLSRSQGAVS